MKILLLLLLSLELVLAQTMNKCLPVSIKDKASWTIAAIDGDANNTGWNVSILAFTDTAIPKVYGPSNIAFRLCGAMTPPANYNCTTVPDGIAYFYEVATGICMPLTMIQSTMTASAIIVNGKIGGVQLDYNNANVPQSAKALMKYNLRYVITCDTSVTSKYDWTFSFSNGIMTLTTKAASGCGYSLTDLLDIFQQNKYITGAVFVLIGLLLAFFGRHAYRWTLLLCGFLLGFLLVAAVCYSFGMFNTSNTSQTYIILGIAVFVGIVLGLLLFYLEKTTVSIVCGILFVLIVKAVFTLFLPNVALNQWVELGILFAAGLIGGILGSIFKE